MKPVNLGVIGLGPRGTGLAHILQTSGAELFEVTAVCDPYPGKVDDALSTLGLPSSAGYANHHDLLQHADVEAVLVETGAQVIAGISCDALRAGKHVLCDVPMMFTRQEAWDLVTTVEQTGLVYCMAEQFRFANLVQHWKQHLEQGDIGAPLFIQGEYIHPVPGYYLEDRVTGLGDRVHGDPVQQANDPRYQKTWRSTFKHPIKYIAHELSPLLKIIDDRVVRVSCYPADARMYGDAVEMLDVECAVMETAKGRVIRIVNSFTAPRTGHQEVFYHWYHIMGTHGLLETARPGWGLDGELIRRKDGTIEQTTYGVERSDSPFRDFAGGHSGMEAFVFQDFYEAIRNNHQTELNVYAAAEATLPGIIAAESAEANGAALDVPDVRPNAGRQPGCFPAEL